MNRSRAPGMLPADEKADTYVDRSLRLYEGVPTIHVTVDSVVFDDGELIGVDRADRLSVFNARLRADRDINAAIALQKPGEVETYLREILSRPTLVSSSVSEGDEYTQRLQQLARFYLQAPPLVRMRAATFMHSNSSSALQTIFRRQR